jgi:hypothetical protein
VELLRDLLVTATLLESWKFDGFIKAAQNAHVDTDEVDVDVFLHALENPSHLEKLKDDPTSLGKMLHIIMSMQLPEHDIKVTWDDKRAWDISKLSMMVTIARRLRSRTSTRWTSSS